MAKKTPPGFISKSEAKRNQAARQKSEPAAKGAKGAKTDTVVDNATEPIVSSSSPVLTGTIPVLVDPATISQESNVSNVEATDQTQTGEANAGGAPLAFNIDLVNPTSADGKGWGYVYKPENPDVRGSVRISKSLFTGAPPATLREALAIVEAAKPKPVVARMTPEQRKEARKNAPVLTFAQKIAKKQEQLNKLIAKAEKEQAAADAASLAAGQPEQPSV